MKKRFTTKSNELIPHFHRGHICGYYGWLHV